MKQGKRELYEGSNGDRWFLGRDAIGELVVIHEPNAASGGRVSSMLVDTFMMATNRGPQHQALQNLIGTLVPKKPGES